jgi:hypothetical protein
MSLSPGKQGTQPYSTNTRVSPPSHASSLISSRNTTNKRATTTTTTNTQSTMPPTIPDAATAIQDLSKIDADISLLLSSASQAFQCLSSPCDDPTSSFREHAEEYHRLLNSITARLRRQIVQLQAAEIPVASQGTIDVGVLNSRNDVVGREMEAELWKEAREFLEQEEGGEQNMEVELWKDTREFLEK